MKFSFHNKLTITQGSKTVEIYNTMFESVYTRLANMESYFDYISVGNSDNNAINNDYKLGNYLASYPLKSESYNSDLSKGILFSKKYALISDSKLDGKNITEFGISFDNSDNPTICNYFSLLSDEYPNGITKQRGEPIELTVCIYLEISESGDGLFTAGDNPFIRFLLGNGCDSKKIYTARGNLFLDNILTKREIPIVDTKYECELNTSIDGGLTLNFSADLKEGETREIIFMLGDEPFARINIEKQRESISKTDIFTPKTNYVIDLGKNVTSVSNVINNTTNTEESNIFTSKYANDFGDKISLPFLNLFDAETPRFLSKDGDKIFFVLDDTIYAYLNKDYKIEKINTSGISFQNLSKIISFDKYVFVISKIKPYISAFVIENNSLIKANIDYSDFDRVDDLSKIFDIDITLAKNNIFMLGYINNDNFNGYALYFEYNESTKTFTFDSYFHSEYRFTYVLAMYKNNFSDATLFFLKGGNLSYECRIVSYFPDKTFEDVYTIVGYFYTYETKEIYTKGRAVVVEKTSSPHMWIYFYPQVYRYNLEILGDEEDDYISTNALYLIQKLANNDYKIYNLVGYNTPTEFINGLPKEIDKSKIESFEFLKDTLLIFLFDEKNKIVAYNFKENNMLIENVTSNEDSYTINYETLNLLGTNNEGVIANLVINIEV